MCVWACAVSALQKHLSRDCDSNDVHMSDEDVDNYR